MKVDLFSTFVLIAVIMFLSLISWDMNKSLQDKITTVYSKYEISEQSKIHFQQDNIRLRNMLDVLCENNKDKICVLNEYGRG